MKTFAAVLILISSFAFADEKSAADATTQTIPPGELYLEKGQAPDVTVSTQNDRQDLKLKLSNGFEVSLDTKSYPEDVTRNFNNLTEQEKTKFLAMREAFMSRVAQGLTGVKLVSGGVILTKNIFYYIGRKSEIVREFYADYFGPSSTDRMITVFRYSPSIVNQGTKTNWTKADQNYFKKIFPFYTSLLIGIDQQLIQTAGTKKTISNSKEFGIELGINAEAAFRLGMKGIGFGGALYLSLGYNWDQHSLFMNVYTDRQRSKMGVNWNFSLSPRFNLYWDKRESAERRSGKQELGEYIAPPGPEHINRVGRRLSTGITVGFPTIAGIAAAHALGAGPWAYALAFTPSLWDLAMATAGRLERAQLFEVKLGAKGKKFYVDVMPGIQLVQSSIVAYWASLMDASKSGWARATNLGWKFQTPNRVLARVSREKMKEKITEKLERHPYAPKCSILLRD